jgi:hypothetical protein
MVMVILMLATACSASGWGDSAPPCDSEGMAVTTDFANRLGYVSKSEAGLDGHRPDVCWVWAWMEVPKSHGSNPLYIIIDEAVEPHGWKRAAQADPDEELLDGLLTWVNADGFEIRVQPSQEAEHLVGDRYVELYGTAAN